MFMLSGIFANFGTMKQWHDFFAMSRHERRGMIALLVLIALLLAGTVGMRYCSRDNDATLQSAAVEQFAAQADSAAVTVRHHRHDRKASPSTRKHKRPRDKKPKPKPAPRRLDPVPQF